MVGWHRQLHGHEFQPTPRDSEGQGSCPAAGHGVAQYDATEPLNKK